MVQQPTHTTRFEGNLFSLLAIEATTLHARFAILVHIRTRAAIFSTSHLNKTNSRRLSHDT
jgi:hypothetical protein